MPTAEVTKTPRKYTIGSKKIGRPTKKTPETISKLVAAFNNLMTDTEACSYAEINPETFYSWMNSDKMFSNKILRAKSHPKMLAKETMIYAVKERKSWMAAAWLLERLEPDQYSLKQKVDLNATVLNVNLTPEQWGSLTNAVDAASTALTAGAARNLPEGSRDS